MTTFKKEYYIMNTKYNNLKKLISKSHYQYIFFNVFYTVIKFPFSNIDQIYYLMEKSYNKEITTNVTFMNLRKENIFDYITNYINNIPT